MGLQPLHPLNPTTCPKCGSERITLLGSTGPTPVVFVAAPPLPRSEHVAGTIETQDWACECEHTWKAISS